MSGSAAWWVVVAVISATQPPYGVEYGTQEAVAANWTIHSGPYSTKSAADAAAAQDNGNTGGQGSGSGSGQWWVLPVPGGLGRAGPSANALYQVVQSASKPSGTVAGPFTTRADAEAWISAKEKSPISPPSPLSGLAAIGDFFAKLGQANTWIRVAEVLLGVGLIIVGLAKLASGTAAGKAAIKAGKAAAIL